MIIIHNTHTFHSYPIFGNFHCSSSRIANSGTWGQQLLCVTFCCTLDQHPKTVENNHGSKSLVGTVHAFNFFETAQICSILMLVQLLTMPEKVQIWSSTGFAPKTPYLLGPCHRCPFRCNLGVKPPGKLDDATGKKKRGTLHSNLGTMA